MSDTKKEPTLRELNRMWSPDRNPFADGSEVKTKRRYVRTGGNQELLNPRTGEISGVATIHSVEERDDAEFVKVFAAGVSAMYGLSKTAMRVFQAILHEYQDTKMHGGFADSIYLHWFGTGLNGREIDMSERTFQNGFKELLLNQFLSPRSANLYWVNSSLFFKGDRVAFIKEYRRKPTVRTMPEPQRDPKTVDWLSGTTDGEE